MNAAPVWPSVEKKAHSGFQESWYLKFNDPKNARALWLRFTMLSSKNGFRKIAELWAVLSERLPDGSDVNKTALKQTFDLSQLKPLEGSVPGVRIGSSTFSASGSQGAIQSKGRTLSWDLKFESAQALTFDPVPKRLQKLGLIKNQISTLGESILVSGSCLVDGKKIDWLACPGMCGHLSGPKSGHSWVWGHCNSFTDEKNQPVLGVFEGITARSRLVGPVALPRLSAFYFLYRDQEYRFNRLRDAVSAKSSSNLNEWKFQVERDSLVFRGHVRSRYRDFAGLKFEDTDGSLLYCSNSKVSDLTLTIYRRGKLEATLKSRGTTAYEIVSRSVSPYVPILI